LIFIRIQDAFSRLLVIGFHGSLLLTLLQLLLSITGLAAQTKSALGSDSMHRL